MQVSAGNIISFSNNNSNMNVIIGIVLFLLKYDKRF